MPSTFPKPLQTPVAVAGLVAAHPVSPLVVVGDTSRVIGSVGSPRNGNAGSIAFIDRKDSGALALIEGSSAGIIVANAGIVAKASAKACLIGTEDPRAWYISALNILIPPDRSSWIAPTAVVSRDAIIGSNVRIGHFAIVEDGVEIGSNSIVGDHAILKDGTTIGSGCVIQAHTMIGSEGVAFHRTGDEGPWHCFPHQGNVHIGDDVRIGVSSCIVRGMLDDTVIGAGCKIGNFVNIAHNCSLAENCWISSNVLLCGAVKLEANVRLAASVSINSRVRVGQGAQIGIGSVVLKDVPAGTSMYGNPAKPLRTMRPI